MIVRVPNRLNNIKGAFTIFRGPLGFSLAEVLVTLTNKSYLSQTKHREERVTVCRDNE